MKKLNSLKLNQLNKAEIEKREMNILKGGNSCSDCCPCRYEGSQCSSGDSYYGGSSHTANQSANYNVMMTI